jgi:protein involved in polysaccharide export with SLBB domain
MTAAVQILKTTRWLAGSLFLMLAFATASKGQGTAQVPGQFQVGDRIALTIEGPEYFADTVVVREGLFFPLPKAGNISVRGIARADAQAYLTKEVAKYMKDATVRATVLIQVAVLGAVGRPGFYSIPTDLLFSDVFARAGGLSGIADPNKVVVKRTNKVVVGEKETQQALAASRTVEQLGISSNDVIEVGDKPQRNFTQYLQVVGVILGIVGLAFSIRNRSH